MTIETIEVDDDVFIDINRSVVHLCPVVDEVDEGTLLITYLSDGQVVELHSLDAFLSTYMQKRISHEQFTIEVLDAVGEVLGAETLTVTTSWRTANSDYKVSMSWDERMVRG